MSGAGAEGPGHRVAKTLRAAGKGARAFFSDWGIRQGIKFALAGTLSLFAALVLRLEEPSWAITTAFALSTPKFVGAIAEKTVFRIAGAAAGAVLGYLITGSLEQNPLLFLLAIGGLVSVTTALYGGTLAPYGFRQCGYTATIVAAQGLADPAFSWKVGLARCEEIVLGIVVTSLVTLLVWPRYAREDFDRQVRGALVALRGLLDERAAHFLDGAGLAHTDVLGRMAGRLANLRKMIRLGSFESRDFRSRLGRIDQAVSCIGALAREIANLGEALSGLPELRSTLEEPIRNAHRAMSAAMAKMADKRVGREVRLGALRESAEGLRVYADALENFRATGAGGRLDATESLEHAGFGVQLHAIQKTLETLESSMAELEESQRESFPAIRLRALTLPPPGWIKAGLRGGLAVAAAMVILDWAKPPGGDMVVVGTYLFTAFVLDSNDRRGDLGVFTDLLRVAGYCVVFFLFLLVAAPALSSYAVMNIALGTVFFIGGYGSEKLGFSSFTTVFWLLVAANLVGFNAQHPTSFQDCVAPPFGLFLAAAISAIFRRTIWPILPQKRFAAHVGKVASSLEKILENRSPHNPETRAQITLSLGEASALASVLEKETLSSENSARVHAYLGMISEAAGAAITGIDGDPSLIPPKLRQEYLEKSATLRRDVAGRLREQRLAFGPMSYEDNLPPIYPDTIEWASGFRAKIRAELATAKERVGALGLLYSQTKLARKSDESCASLSRIDLRQALGDWRL